ncbi:oxygen-regulated 1 [Pelobates cultripes]|uniref:Oxygen-regulated 1 n=1 Tax=Pelobates cultripes TaxID=61616 RepID=A0AAD1W5T2_PELCU|nr:oxygen-regulated 1 [Pelobates cultripes]
MSDTTSTNISVAQANSTDSGQTGSMRQSNMSKPGSTKRLYFYKSGDPRFNGIKMVVTNRSIKTFDALLDSLSKKVPLPFGVRNITTPRGMHHITNLEELEDGRSYICSHQRKIKPINLERASKKPLLWKSSRPMSARRRAVQLAQHNEVVPFQRENTIVIGNSKKLVIFKNGDTEFKYNVIFNQKSMQSFDAFLEEISEALQCPIVKLYSTDGRRILSIHALLLSSGTIVAAGREPFKHANYETEREFLPSKLPGITKRVIPKQRSKPEMKSQIKTDEPIFNKSSGQKLSLSSDKICNTEFVDFPYMPTNEISITEHWPHSGEKLPVISPEDNIEKSIHLNFDGTMTVEMRVRFKIKEEETINWSTTVSRSDLLYHKQKLPSSTVEPDIQAIYTSDSPLETNVKDIETPKDCLNQTESKNASCSEINQLETNVPAINSNVYRTTSSRQESARFYRPPTPGIRRGQERKSSMKQISAGNIREHIRQMFFSGETEQEDTDSGIVAHCDEQMLNTGETANTQSNENNEMDNINEECLPSMLRQESFDVVETTSMKVLQRDTRTKRVVKKSEFTTESSGYACFGKPSQNDQPHSVGKHVLHQDHFKFKELKRSVSESISLLHPSMSQAERFDFAHCKPGSLDAMSKEAHRNVTKEGNTCENNSHLTSESQMNTSFENDVDNGNDTQLRISAKQKKKKKKQMVGSEINCSFHQDAECYTSMEAGNMNGDVAYDLNDDAQIPQTAPNYKQSPKLGDVISCDLEHQDDSNIPFDDVKPQDLSCPKQTEIGIVKKLKGNKQMAKVKPRAVKKITEPSSPPNDKSVGCKTENNVDDNPATETGTGNGIATIITREPLLYSCEHAINPPMEHNLLQEGVRKKTIKPAKKFHDLSKKQNKSKKKNKNKMTESKKLNAPDNQDTRSTSSPTPVSSAESYVQSWLTKIFPNATFPVIQLFPSTRRGEDIISYSNSQGDQLEKETKMKDQNDLQANSHNSQSNSCVDSNKMEPVLFHVEHANGKDMMMLHTGPFDEEVISTLMEKGKQLAELFMQQCENNAKIEQCGKDKLLNWMANNQMAKMSQKKESSDVAVQVELKAIEKDPTDHTMNDCIDEILAQQLNSTPQYIPKTKIRHLEKSLSLQEWPSKPTGSSSQVLLAWLLVLHLKQGMQNMIEDITKRSCAGSEIFALLQVLKKIAITEKADDLKAAVLSLQESALRQDSSMENLACAGGQTSTQLFPNVPEKQANIVKDIASNHSCSINAEYNVTDRFEDINLLNTERENSDLIDDLDDLTFFASVPETEVCGEYRKNDRRLMNIEAVTQCSSDKEPEESTNNSSNEVLDNIDQFLLEEGVVADNEDSDDMMMKSTQRFILSPLSDISFGNNPSVQMSTISPRKTSKVKMIVQEMEQRKHPSNNSDYKKSVQSPLSSDWSDYKQDSEESSKSDTLQGSSDIITESGDEKIQEKPIKTGYVRRAIERLYGKSESKVSPCNTAVCASTKKVVQKSPNETIKTAMKENVACNHQSSSKENMMRTLSSPNNCYKDKSSKDCTSSLKSASFPILEPAYSPNNALGVKPSNKGGLINTSSETNDGVLIDKGRWLLKEDNLVRMSPPQAIGMYGHLDTTSIDTFLDTTSDEVPYSSYVGKMNQQLPLADVSSSEIEDMVRPHHCNYFNMPHGSDSEPFNDTFNVKAECRPKSSEMFVKIKSRDSDSPSSRSLLKYGGKSGSLPSFATVDLHFSDNKVHPVSHPEGQKDDVYITFYGHLKASEPVFLYSNEDDAFQSGHEDTFQINIGDIGEIYKIRVGHDNSGESPSWHCEAVHLLNIFSNEQFSIDVNRWLAQDQDDKEICRELPVSRQGHTKLPVTMYEIRVVTGDLWNAGTDANIYISIHGERGDTGSRHLLMSNKPNKFLKGQTDIFMLEAVHLGDLHSLVIGHDGLEPGNGWYLEKVIVLDPVKDREYIFFCYRWLDKGEDDGKIARHLFTADEVDFPARQELELKRKHIWNAEKWKYQKGNILQFYCKATRKFIRLTPDSKVDALGEKKDKYGFFDVMVKRGNVRVFKSHQISSVALAIDKGIVTAMDNSGILCELFVHPQLNRNVTLESTRVPGLTISFDREGRANDGSTDGYAGITKEFVVHVKGIFQDGSIILLTTSWAQALCRRLDGLCSGAGNHNTESYWKVQKMNSAVYMFESVTNPHNYIQIKNGKCDGNGSGDDYCSFKVDKQLESGSVTLESIKYNGIYIGLQSNGNAMLQQ